jgi:hypothetical protein
MTKKLKPCPWCGVPPEIYKAGKWYAECDNVAGDSEERTFHRVEIGGVGNMVSREEVIEAWNRRDREGGS